MQNELDYYYVIFKGLMRFDDLLVILAICKTCNDISVKDYNTLIRKYRGIIEW
jgi:hypothetical protein